MIIPRKLVNCDARWHHAAVNNVRDVRRIAVMHSDRWSLCLALVLKMKNMDMDEQSQTVRHIFSSSTKTKSVLQPESRDIKFDLATQLATKDVRVLILKGEKC